MFPAQIFSLFPPFPRDHKVFVAMSFDHQFDARWRDVISPAIESIKIGETRLEPHRVDTRRVSDSILTEILMGIANSRLVFADITTVGMVGDKAVRNGNVMYEVGIAQAVRLAEEVILFRSDNDDLLFDTANVRVNFYSPDTDAKDARASVAGALQDGLKEVDLRKQIAVRSAAESLDVPSMDVLANASVPGGMPHPSMRTMGNAVANASVVGAIARLLEMGALRTQFMHVSEIATVKREKDVDVDYLTYKCTEFGQAVFDEVSRRMGIPGPTITAAMRRQRDSKREKK